MQKLKPGKYFGIPQRTFDFNGLLLVDNEYIHEKVGWHCHENPYFTYLLSGRLQETSKKDSLLCVPGTLIFHNSSEAHYNIKPPGYTRGFQVEFTNNWFGKFDINTSKFEGVFEVLSPDIKFLFAKIYKETIIHDEASKLSIEGALLQIFCRMVRLKSSAGSSSFPAWLNIVKQILHDEPENNISLSRLARETGVHPVHISKSFHKYFKITLGEYLRRLKTEKSITLMADKTISLTEISTACGFSDQSHFIRTFKSQFGITPSRYRKHISKS
jgi:AraC-like DNA-binding protein